MATGIRFPSPPLGSRFVISQKVTTSCATIRLSSLTVLATHHTDGSRHGVMPGVIVFPAAAATAAVHPLDKQIFVWRPLCARPNFKPSFTRRRTGRDVRGRSSVALKELFLKHFRRNPIRAREHSWLDDRSTLERVQERYCSYALILR